MAFVKKDRAIHASTGCSIQNIIPLQDRSVSTKGEMHHVRHLGDDAVKGEALIGRVGRESDVDDGRIVFITVRGDWDTLWQEEYRVSLSRDCKIT